MHVLLVFERHKSIKIPIYPAFSCLKHFLCLHRSKFVYDMIKVSFLCFDAFYTQLSQVKFTQSVLIPDSLRLGGLKEAVSLSLQ